MKITKYSNNPILLPNPANQWENVCVSNPGVYYDDVSKKFIMLYRAAGNDTEHYIRLGLAVSDDGFSFKRVSDKPAMDVVDEYADGGCIEDPRIVKIDSHFYITYASKPFYPGRYWIPEELKIRDKKREEQPSTAPAIIRNADTVTYLACTNDFRRFKRLGRITDSRYDDRDVVIFPEKINGRFVKISRPKRNGRSYGIWITYSDDLLEWGEPAELFRGEQEWESERIGAGCPPVKTKYGWLLLYHGISARDQYYRVGFVLLDLTNPSKILARTKDYVMEPEYDYETKGLWDGCIFPTGMVRKDGIFYIYYGCADKYVSVATVPEDELLEYMISLK